MQKGKAKKAYMYSMRWLGGWSKRERAVVIVEVEGRRTAGARVVIE